ncbi:MULTISPECIES: porin family protein [Hymenobacter]|uniref:PorT family protein n=2 Tax=Hymenobacter TaxID=89966 RepID=A0ABS6X615_9BACT|nr:MULTISPECIES: porin family protein [Hymenobacter]MBO3270146.1 PorT family protein [Hymenobacter defluvii]MBW3131155.1 PorT family protein [Hymenobacter profundi]QNE41014.1 PorT family protein [Hymenobacter sp. NBH84]
MKKITLLLVAFAASFSLAHAQVRPGGAMSSTDYFRSSSDSRNNGFGVKGGFNLTNVHGDDKGGIPARENLNTFHAGVYAQFGLSSKVAIQPELLYSRQGYRYDQTQGGTTEQRVNRLDYLKVPVLLTYNFLDNVSVHVGPQVALLTKVKNAGVDQSIDDYGYHSLDYGVVGGIEFRVGPARIGGRYDLGLAKIRKDGYATTGTAGQINVPSGDVRNQAFQVYLGLGISN